MARDDAVVRLEGRLVVPQVRPAVHQDAQVLQQVHHRVTLRPQAVAPLVEPELIGKLALTCSNQLA